MEHDLQTRNRSKHIFKIWFTELKTVLGAPVYSSATKHAQPVWAGSACSSGGDKCMTQAWCCLAGPWCLPRSSLSPQLCTGAAAFMVHGQNWTFILVSFPVKMCVPACQGMPASGLPYCQCFLVSKSQTAGAHAVHAICDAALTRTG